MRRARVKMTVVVGCLALACGMLAGCGKDPGPSPTVPPTPPTHRLAQNALPRQVSGYTVLGSTPAAGQTTATYARDAQPLDVAQVTFDASGTSGETTLSGEQWYSASRCGTLWTSDSKASPAPSQVACVTPLADGVLTVVSGGEQTVQDLADLANAIYQSLSE